MQSCSHEVQRTQLYQSSGSMRVDTLSGLRSKLFWHYLDVLMLQKGGPSIEYLNIAHSITVWTCQEQEICWEILVFLHLQRNAKGLFSQNHAHGLAHHDSLANSCLIQAPLYMVSENSTRIITLTYLDNVTHHELAPWYLHPITIVQGCNEA